MHVTGELSVDLPHISASLRSRRGPQSPRALGPGFDLYDRSEQHFRQIERMRPGDV